jgi:GTP-binding protein
MIETVDLAAGEWLFTRPAAFERGVSRAEDLPPADRTEVALCGRSNVGKSSLLNSLTGRRALARVSHTPGRTRELNFFRVPAEAIGLYLVDLPGYGFAAAPKKRVADWNELLRQYLRARATLRRVFLLIDARHGLKEADEPFLSTFDEDAISYQLVFTKCDKVSAQELGDLRAQTEVALRQHAAAHPLTLTTSSVTGEGVGELRASIAGLIDLAALGYKGPRAEGGQA